MNARSLRWFVCPIIAACVFGGAPVRADDSAFDRLSSYLVPAYVYTMRVESHEEDGDRSEDLAYVYRSAGAGANARLEIREGRGSGIGIVDHGNGRVAVSIVGKPGVAILHAGDARLTSLRGVTLAGAGMEAFVRCVRSHRSALKEIPGPEIDGVSTIALIFDRTAHVRCPADSPRDGAVSTDVVYVAARTAEPVLRKRYVGREIVERWRIRDFSIQRTGSP